MGVRMWVGRMDVSCHKGPYDRTYVSGGDGCVGSQGTV